MLRGVLCPTRRIHYYKSYRSKSFAHPLRRWLYHYLFAGALVGTAGYITLRYQLAKREANRYYNDAQHTSIYNEGSSEDDDMPPHTLCSSGMLDFLLVLPHNRLSNVFGRLAESTALPRAWHERAIAFLVWWYNIDLAECASQDFNTLQDFYVRRWTEAARPVAPEVEALAVVPCDGVVLAVEENIMRKDGNTSHSTLVQVKGLRYGLDSLLRTRLPEVPAGMRRVAFTLQLRLSDFHHVIAPTEMKCERSVYVPGALLPTTPAGFHFLPALLTYNERVVVCGEQTHCCTRRTRRKESNAPVVALALVGGTLTGRIKLAIDAKLRTNFLDPPEYAVTRSYTPAMPLTRGALLGTFYWGSAVVLLIDVPTQSELLCKVGQSVKAGQALVRRTTV